MLVVVGSALLGYCSLRAGPGQPAAGPPSPAAPASPAPASPVPATGGPPNGSATPAPPTPPATSDPLDAGNEGPPTAAPTAAAPAAEDAVVVDDEQGDLRDTAGLAPAAPQPAGDLRRVTLAAVEAEDGSRALQARFDLAGEVPARADTIVWSVQVRDAAGEPLATITAQLLGARTLGGVFDWRTQRQSPVEPVVDARRVLVTVPAEVLSPADLPAGATWSALAQVDEAYEDAAGSAEAVPVIPR